MNASTRTVTIGTRGSALALHQANLAAVALRGKHERLDVEIVIVRTPGDVNQSDPISSIGDKGVFVRAIERSLLDGEIDIAVHSLKDVPIDEGPGLVLAAYLTRDIPNDAAIVRNNDMLERLPDGSRVGTGSLRRRVQLRDIYPKLEFAGVRGNVDTRLRKLDQGDYDALILAAAGLKRLGLDGRVSSILDVNLCVPGAGQGTIAVQCREGDPIHTLARAIDDPVSRICSLAEREALRALGADCHSPVGIHAEARDALHLIGCFAADANSRPVRASVSDWPMGDPLGAGRELAAKLTEALSDASIY